MFIIKCDTVVELWSNSLDHNFLGYLAKKYFSKRLGRLVGESEMEVYYIDDENDRFRADAHHKAAHHGGFRISGKNRKLEMYGLDGEKNGADLKIKKIKSWGKPEDSKLKKWAGNKLESAADHTKAKKLSDDFNKPVPPQKPV